MNGNSEGEYNISLERMEKLVNIYNNLPLIKTCKDSNIMNDTDINQLIEKKVTEYKNHYMLNEKIADPYK
jgi:hypothetical protein